MKVTFFLTLLALGLPISTAYGQSKAIRDLLICKSRNLEWGIDETITLHYFAGKNEYGYRSQTASVYMFEENDKIFVEAEIEYSKLNGEVDMPLDSVYLKTGRIEIDSRSTPKLVGVLDATGGTAARQKITVECQLK